MNKRNILITGGAGFIGSHAIRLFVNKYPDDHIINFDLLTYAGNLENLRDVDAKSNYSFVKGDIMSEAEVEKAFSDFDISHVIHFAAESHVDRSITDPLAFLRTNILGTVNLMQVAKKHWRENGNHCFYNISTDEVYGSLGDTGLFLESTSYDPQSPYSASKASSDHFVRAYANTYGFPVKISNCSNNYGPNQFPEKLLPLMIHNILNKRPLPVYGDGTNIRDWLYVVDHVEAIENIFSNGRLGETYNIGGDNEIKNIDLVRSLCRLMDEELGREVGESEKLITFVKDRPGHDKRYAIDASKIKNELGWTPRYTVDEGLKSTIQWYLSNKDWLEHVTSRKYQEYYKEQYGA
ncbi:MAG: dTDP-glucose 4,6-dehydratase [Saprospiraceae bacterium]